MIAEKVIKTLTCDWCGSAHEVLSYKMQVRQFDGYDRHEYCEDHIELCAVCQNEALTMLKAHKKPPAGPWAGEG